MTGVTDTPAAAAVKGLHHVGVVVDSLDEAVGFLTGTLGFELVFRAADADAGDDVAFVRCGPVRLELLQLGDPDERRRRLGDGQARIDHLALEVSDLVSLSSALESSGVEFASEPFDRGLGPMRFTVPETTDGVTYQLLELRPRS